MEQEQMIVAISLLEKELASKISPSTGLPMEIVPSTAKRSNSQTLLDQDSDGEAERDG